ncbi:MAG: ABC transporter ATP-binding protein [Deltaproteobacteria bacterium]|nr:ABC transporter ATP-binding protein [Deltaproteobacteria bacterium]
MDVLELKMLGKTFGGLQAVENINFKIQKGDIFGLIGPNGAGKTTTFNLITGVYPPSNGGILFEGGDIAGMKTHEIAKMGIARTFQITSLFKEYSVLENVLTGFHLSLKSDLLSSLFPGKRKILRKKAITEKAMEMLSFVEIEHLKDEKAKNLSFGHQRLLGISIALALDPKLLMLDEPVGGLNPAEIKMIIDMVGKIRDRRRDIAILLVEHNMPVVMSICNRIVVMNFGVKIAEGSPEEIRTNPDVIRAYLGSSYDA